MNKSRSGFTIVELLIVIVVIGVLAAITIVAYNGVQQRARESTLRSDLSNVAAKMAADRSLNDSYALTAAAVDEGRGLPASNGTTYQYHSTASSYCITGTNKNTSFTISDGTPSPAPGGCAGDGQGGADAITNLAINPSAAVNLAYWSVNSASASVSRDAAATRPGSPTNGSIKTAFTVAGTVSTQLWDGSTTPLIAVTSGDTVNISAWVKASVSGRSINIAHRWRDSSNNQLSQTSQTAVALPTSWTQISFSAPAPAGAVYDHASFYVTGQVGDNWWIDDVMITKGGSAANYADGNSPNWIWNGTPNNSTSTGPAQ